MDVRFFHSDVEFGILEVTVDPQLALPIHVAAPEIPRDMSLAGSQVMVSLTEYRPDAPPPEDMERLLEDFED